LVLTIAAATLGTLALAVALANFSQDSNTKNVPYNVKVDANAKCHGDKHVNFGGFKTNTKGDSLYSGPIVWPGAMAPKGSDTDKLSVEGSSNSVNGGRLTAIAYCKGGGEPKIKKKTDIVLPSAANDDLRQVKAKCPSDKYVIGGGWSAEATAANQQQKLAIMGLERTTNRTWQVSVTNDTGAQQAVTAIALCGNTRSPTEKETTVDVHETDDATATAQCPQGKEVVFGGFRGDFHLLSGINAFVFKFFLAGDDEIKVYGAHNFVGPNDDDVSDLTAIAYCK
jgi:hypothetical protein